MSSGQPIASGEAGRRIGRFSSVLWTGGAVVMAVIAFATFARLEWNPDTGTLRDTAGGSGYSDLPWEDEGIPEVEEQADGVYAGEGNAVIRIDGVTTAPLQVTQLGDVYVSLSMTESGDIDPDRPAEDREWPLRVGDPQPDLPAVVFPYAGTLELWVEAEEAWQLRIEDLDAEEITDVASGKGNALLVYSGSSVSALFEFAGEGIFFVTAYTREEGEDSLIIESEPLRERHSWSPSDTVVLRIESDADRGAWVVDIDSYDDETPSTPAPSGPASSPVPGAATAPEKHPAKEND